VRRGNAEEKDLEDYRPSGYPDVTLKHYDPRSTSEDED